MANEDQAVPAKPKRQLAIALKYERGQEGAPVVAAAGKGAIAEKIIEVAEASGVPVVEQAHVAEALTNVEIGKEVPPSLYRAVAEVLAFVYRLDRKVLNEQQR